MRGCIFAFVAGWVLATVAAMADAGTLHVYFGTYTRGDENPARGIYRSRFDPGSGALSEPELVAETTNPSFLAMHPDGHTIYAAIESGTFDGSPGGGLVAWRIAPDGSLVESARRAVGAPGPCHLATDATGRLLAVANYGGGSVSVFPLDADGVPAKTPSLHQHAGSGPDKRRQKGPHAHGVTFSPGNGFAVVPDLGIDQLRIYRFNPTTPALAPAEATAADVAPGAGPRHLAFSPDGRHAYAVNELDNSVSVFSWDEPAGRLDPTQTLSTLPEGWSGRSHTAEIAVAPTGEWVAASNRGHDSIAIFRRNPTDGTLALPATYPSGGKTPRSFAFSPCGNWILSANQDSNNVAVFTFDRGSGTVGDTGSRIELGMPVCVLFAP